MPDGTVPVQGNADATSAILDERQAQLDLQRVTDDLAAPAPLAEQVAAETERLVRKYLQPRFAYSVYHPDEVGSAGWPGRAYFHSGWNDRNAALDAARIIKGFVVAHPIIADFRVEGGRLD